VNIALIIAGGVGSRTQQQIPKQFINVLDKPIIIYTLERFQQSDLIDAIEVVCLDGWEEILKAYALQYGIAKLKWVIKGGASSHESIYKGLASLKNVCKDDDIVIIHDGIRPMVEPRILRSCIDICKKHGNGITSLPVYEQVFVADTEETSTKYIPRESIRILQTPQAYKYGIIMDAYEEGYKNALGFHNSSYANTLMTDLGKTLYFSEGSTLNIKITTKEDIDIFRAMLSKGDKNEI
jgi:2-C-methyl-D-erythritol 4-phosphate cytidylyltransferase